ncbi:uncharacterized protein VICG_02163 [Vittaforma corneae ATCC 50505]|uniref:Disease resistance R13L4/SHOC-2-like LRR domain-containing protein n=1 Tax=Vittaforma corneae (strain ATCC 50505) TaxID=993615 RepID=L2GJV6_VITCO|nr:uncharacterized protein VICG_02163 [Vittaforma corneae ATCC 50505]ELA40800.1 hypothetical protein VICG_02163 [Vittaforma corneae ATCC 50505]
MNIIRTKKAYKVICGLVVLIGATLQSSGNVTNPESVQDPKPLEGSGAGGQTVRSLHYSFEKHSEGETDISIPFQGITSIDCNIKRFVKLESLSLGGNKLKTLPPEIGELRNLRELNLRNNEFEIFPNIIGELRNLQYLFFDGNEFELLPSEIGKLENLQELHLNSNKLKSLPPEIGKLENLKILDLSCNKLSTLPNTIRELPDSLQLLDLRGNSILEVGEKVKTLGRGELREIFRGRVVFDRDALRRPQ